MIPPDVRDLDDLLQQLQERHPIFFSVAIVLSAFGTLGILCILRCLK